MARLEFVQVRRLGLVAGLIAGIPSCATTWDDVTARNFHVRSIWESSDPMTVLHDSTDGDERAKALRALKEPRANGGNDAEQDRVIQVLTQAAVSDRQPLCRLAAIQTLGRFRDPRCVQILTAAYDAAPQLPNEVAGAIQSATLVSLGNTKQQTAIAFLVRAAMNPTPAEAVDREINQSRDVRLTAVRALKNYEGSAEVASAMVQIMRAERDVALQDRAHETYVKVTGREPPADSQAPMNAPTPLPTQGEDVKLTGGVK